MKKLFTLALSAIGMTSAAATVANAAPYLTLDLLGRVQNSGNPYSSTVFARPGDDIEYAVQIQLGTEGTINPFAGFANQSQTKTIANWIPSEPGNSYLGPTSGLNNLQFSLWQDIAAGDTKVNFGTTLTAMTTDGVSWASGIGADVGTVTARGDGNNDLKRVFLTREAGTFDGIAANPDGPGEIQEQLIIATGLFTVTAGGNMSSVNIGTDGYGPTNLIAGIRWRSSDNTANHNYTPRVSHQLESVAAGDPIIVYNNLSISAPPLAIPEPASLGLLGLGAVGLLGRRHRNA